MVKSIVSNRKNKTGYNKQWEVIIVHIGPYKVTFKGHLISCQVVLSGWRSFRHWKSSLGDASSNVIYVSILCNGPSGNSSNSDATNSPAMSSEYVKPQKRDLGKNAWTESTFEANMGSLAWLVCTQQSWHPEVWVGVAVRPGWRHLLKGWRGI